jgi:hypothetical protein
MCPCMCAYFCVCHKKKTQQKIQKKRRSYLFIFVLICVSGKAPPKREIIPLTVPELKCNSSNSETKQHLKQEVKAGKKEMDRALQEVLTCEATHREEVRASLLSTVTSAVETGELGLSSLLSRVKELVTIKNI